MKTRRMTPCVPTLMLLLSLPVMAASPYLSGIPLAVIPVHDGVSDSIADELRTSIANALAQNPGIHVVAQDRVAEVMAYQAPSYSKSDAQVQLAHALMLQARAKEHYLNFASEEAKVEIQAALAEIRSSPLSVSDKGAILRDALVTAAVISADSRTTAETDAFFEEVLRLDPNFKLDTTGFSPALRKKVDRVRHRMTAAVPGQLAVTSNPKMAEVWVNGVSRGAAPLTLQLPAGAYEVRVSGNRYTSFDQRVVIRPNETATVAAKLKWAHAVPKPSPNSVDAGEAQALIQKGQELTALLRLQKVVLLDVDTDPQGGGEIRARMIDATTKASHHPVHVRFRADRSTLPKDVAQMVKLLTAQATMKRIDNPVAQLDPAGVGDPIVLGRRKGRRITPLGWGVIGGVAGGGALAGILAAVLSGSGGGDSSPNSGVGSIHVQLSQ